MHFNKAIVRPPANNFSQGITSAGLGLPDISLAREQHQAYCMALENCGLAVTVLDPDHRFPDSTFVEDAAVITEKCAVLTRPGADSRRGEVDGIKPDLACFREQVHAVQAPGTLDGGDVCQVDDHFFIGLSDRTNADGAHQLASILIEEGYSCSFINLDGYKQLLHLKSGIAYLGDGRMVMKKGLETLAEFPQHELILVDEDESYAANCLRVNDFVLVAAGFPKFTSELSNLGYQVILLDVSEFQKMDGGLSCLSLRFA